MDVPKCIFSSPICVKPFMRGELKAKEDLASSSTLKFSFSEKAKNVTPSIPEIICAKNVRAIVVCGFLMKSL